jgi:IS5 family transposase
MSRCDSFVVKTDVHYPTDINLLFDAIRKAISVTAALAQREKIEGWRQSRHNIKQVKKAYRKAQQIKRSTSNNEDKKQARLDKIEQTHSDYIALCQHVIDKVTLTINAPTISVGFISIAQTHEIEGYIVHAKRQIDQITRRVLKDEKIAHSEKTLSIFQPHTEWINKGKAGVPVELGLRVCIVESTSGYILHHQVMQKSTDDQIAISIVEETKQRFPSLIGCSFDKGFHSPANQLELAKQLEKVVLPKKGKRNKEEEARETSKEFRQYKRQHSAVESGINALEVHGLDKCPDHGLDGFQRYVALAVVARNLQKLGSDLHKQQQKKEKRRRDRDKIAA